MSDAAIDLGLQSDAEVFPICHRGIVMQGQGDTLLRRLALLSIAAVIAALLVGGIIFAFLIWPNFQRLEDEEAAHWRQAIVQAVHSEQDRLRDLANTYAVWDVPFDYVMGVNPQFAERDLSPQSLDQIDVDGVFVANNLHEVLFRGASVRGRAWRGLLPAIENALANAPELRLQSQDTAKTGLIVFGGEVAIISVRRILHTDGTGPSPGVIALARVIDRDIHARMTALTATRFDINVVGEGPGQRLQDTRTESLLADVNGDALIRLRVIGAPDVLNLGRATAVSWAATVSLALIALAAVFARALTSAVVSPVRRLIGSIDVMSRGAEPPRSARRVPAEIEQLTAAFVTAFQRARQEAALHRAAHEEAVAARAATEQANRAKSRFLATMSHELHTPLNAVIGYSDMMQEAAVAEGRSGDAEDHARVLSAARGLLTLINSILDFSRAESGQLALMPERFDVYGLARSIADVARPSIVSKGLKFNVAIDGDLGHANSDPTRIKQCVTNLLANAAKFTSAGSVSFRAARRREVGGDWLMFAVEDTGIGMTRDQIKRIYEPFTQADDAITRAYGGAGLGLSITRDLVSRLGGRIGVKSSLGLGARFVIRIPALLPGTGGLHMQAGPRRQWEKNRAGWRPTAPAVPPENDPCWVDV